MKEYIAAVISAAWCDPANKNAFLPKLCKALHNLGRKNWLFAGTHDTAQNAAMIYSLFATCKKHNINPHDWLTDVLRKMNDDGYEGKFSDLLPHRWRRTKE